MTTTNEKLAERIYKESHITESIFSMTNGEDIINDSIMKALLRMAEEKDREIAIEREKLLNDFKHEIGKLRADYRHTYCTVSDNDLDFIINKLRTTANKEQA